MRTSDLGPLTAGFTDAKVVALIGIILAPILFLFFAERFVRENEGLRPGDVLPEAKLLSTDGSHVETHSWRGKPLLLVLILPACKACRAEIESLESIAPSFPDLKVVLLSLGSSLGASETPFPLVVDPSGDFVQKTRKLIVPTLYWIDADGKVLYARTGPRSPETEAATFRQLANRSELQDQRSGVDNRD